MEIDSIDALLTISSGKCVCIQKMRGSSRHISHQLVAKNLQDNEEKAQIKVYNIFYQGSKNNMAFCFEVGNEAIFPFVTDDKEVEFKVFPSKKQFKETDFNKNFLFQRDEEGRNDWYRLKSVAQPSMYLFVERNTVTIHSVGKPDFRIEKINTAQTMCWRPNKLNVRTSCESQGSNQGSSCCEATMHPTKLMCSRKRKTKKIKTPVKRVNKCSLRKRH